LALPATIHLMDAGVSSLRGRAPRLLELDACQRPLPVFRAIAETPARPRKGPVFLYRVTRLANQAQRMGKAGLLACQEGNPGLVPHENEFRYTNKKKKKI